VALSVSSDFAGTEEIERKETAQWLRAFSAARPDNDIDSFRHGLAADLTRAWKVRDLTPS
jgi:hypothetical protein